MGHLKHILMRLTLGIAVAATFLLLIEAGLRLLPLDRWERDCLNRSFPLLATSFPLFVPGSGPQANQWITNAHFKGAVSFQTFPKDKPLGVRRIFILGGSAAKGWPGSADAAFSGYMQRALDKTAPGRFEIINAAAMSYGSHRVRDLLQDVLRLEPDLIVIWSGNNEYIEHNELPTFVRSAVLGRVQRILRHSGLYRALRLGLQAAAPNLFVRLQGADDLTDLRRIPLVRRGMMGRSATSDRRILDNFRATLQAMAGLIREHGVIGVLCTVPVNLVDWAPANLRPEIGNADLARRWFTLQNLAVQAWAKGDYREAEEISQQLLAMTPAYALGHYLLADSLRHQRQIDEARREYALACDLDNRPIRAITSFQEVIREIADKERMVLADLQLAFEDNSEDKLPGLRLFLDYVHPNEAGRKLAAITLLTHIVPRLDPGLNLRHLTEHVAADAWLSEHPDNKVNFLYAQGMTYQNNGDFVHAEQTYLAVLAEKPDFNDALGNLGVIYEQQGRPDAAVDYYRRAVNADPASFHAINLAKLFFQQGERRKARGLAEQALRQGYVDATLFFLLGDIEAEDLRFAEALRYYQEALKAGGATAALFTKIGNVYHALGDEAKARAAFEQAAGSN